MDNSLSSGMQKLKTSDVFKQKGGTFGIFLIAAGIVGLLFFMPEIVAWVNNLFRLIVTLAACAGVLFVLTDKNIRLVVSTTYMLGIRKLISAIIKIDPISILKDTIKRMYHKIDMIEMNMGKLNGVKMDLKNKIADKKEDLQDCINRKKVAERQGKKELIILEDRQSVRLQGLTQDYIDLYDSTEKWYAIMSKIAEKAKFVVADAENEVEAQEEKYKIVKLSHNTFKSAMSIINGNPDELALYNEAFKFISDDIMEKLGEMDRVISSSGGIIDQIDVDNEVMSLKGSDLMKKYEELGIDALFTKLESKPKSDILMISSQSVNSPITLASMKTAQMEGVKTNSKYF